MQVAVLGAAGRIGRFAVDEALDRGWTVRAVVRPGIEIAARKGLTRAPVDFDDPAGSDALPFALRGVEAVIDCLGPRSATADGVAAFRETARRLIAAMDDTGVRRIVVLAGAGVRVPGERRTGADRLLAAVVRRFARPVVAAEQAEFDLVAATDRLWTVLRPPFVIDGPRTGRYQLSESSPPIGSRITRADVGVALVDLVPSAEWLGKAPFAWSVG